MCVCGACSGEGEAVGMRARGARAMRSGRDVALCPLSRRESVNIESYTYTRDTDTPREISDFGFTHETIAYHDSTHN